MRTIRVPAGIGDCCWLLQKLINTGERFNFQLTNAKPQRGKQIFDLLPQVAASCQYVQGLSYETVDKYNIQKKHRYWKDIEDRDFLLSCNRHLEEGNRIEKFFPDLGTTYVMPWQTGISKIYLSDASSYIGIYPSCYKTNNAWNFWKENEWFELISKIHLECPEACFVIIGALFDIDLCGPLIKMLQDAKIPYCDTVGQSLGYFIEVANCLDFFISFPSGLPILNETIRLDPCPTLMFYPRDEKHYGLMQSWARPERLLSHRHVPRLFCSVEDAFNTLCNECNLFDYIK